MTWLEELGKKGGSELRWEFLGESKAERQVKRLCSSWDCKSADNTITSKIK